METIKRKSLVCYTIGVALVLCTAIITPGEKSFAKQDQDTTAPQDVLTRLEAETVRNRIEELKIKLTLADSAENQETADQLGVSLPELQEHNADLRKLSTVYQRYLTALDRQDSLQKEEKSLGKLLDSQQETLIVQTEPSNLSTYDSILDELATLEQQEQTISIALKSGKKLLEEAKTDLDRRGQQVREANENLDSGGETDKALLLSWLVDDAKIEEELATALVHLQRTNVANSETELRLVQLKRKLARRHVDWFRSKLSFDASDLENHLDLLEENRAALQTRSEKLRQGQQDVEDAWLAAQKELEAAQGGDETGKVRITASLKALDAWRETYQKMLEQTETILLALEQEKLFWQRRYGLLEKNTSRRELDNWEEETQAYLKSVDQNISIKEKYQTDLHTEISTIQKQLGAEDTDPETRQNLESHLHALNKMAESGFEYLTLMRGTRSIGQRLLDEIDLRQKDILLMNKISGLGTLLQDIWETELWVVDERSVTVRKLVIIVIILFIGMLIARWLANTLVKKILVRTRLDKSATTAIAKMLFYLALVFLSVFALRYVNIPLTVFTFLGGAIAIGAGIGAQKLLNNFISGFILLLERPVKINDMIEVESNFGIIENIGMRCTRVRTPGNVHVLVPNSSFLEKNIVNWTLSDQEIRAKVALGVAYSSDPDNVSRLMIEAVSEHDQVLKEPNPLVLFDDMGTNSLVFIVYFWISMKNLQLLERRVIESDIRYRIMRLFREAGIVLAFPQRDVHLDTSKPLDFRLVAADKGSDSADENIGTP